MELPRAFIGVQAVVAAVPAAAVAAPATYLTVEQAQAAMFPSQKLERLDVTLTREQVRAIEKNAGGRLLTKSPPVWRASGGGWFIVDEVIGRYDRILYAVGLNSDGAIRGVEILVYREAHGGEVRNPKWLAQFRGREVSDPPRFEDNIQNITGATLSCRHVSDGVRRVLELHAQILRRME